jgi:putative addiction module killer protein
VSLSAWLWQTGSSGFFHPGSDIDGFAQDARLLLDKLYLIRYIAAMNMLIRSSVFSDWLNGLKDQKAKARILHRLSQASLGNFGDCEPVGEGVSEMRIHHGPGYRVYFVRHGAAVYVLLCGGDKSSQRRDIAKARLMARELKESGL